MRGTANGDKAENEFSPLYPHSLLTVARCARHSHPSPPEKKAASRKKSRLRRKKLRLWGIEAIDTIDAIDAIEGVEEIVWGIFLNRDCLVKFFWWV